MPNDAFGSLTKPPQKAWFKLKKLYRAAFGDAFGCLEEPRPHVDLLSIGLGTLIAPCLLEGARCLQSQFTILRARHTVGLM